MVFLFLVRKILCTVFKSWFGLVRRVAMLLAELSLSDSWRKARAIGKDPKMAARLTTVTPPGSLLRQPAYSPREFGEPYTLAHIQIPTMISTLPHSPSPFYPFGGWNHHRSPSLQNACDVVPSEGFCSYCSRGLHMRPPWLPTSSFLPTHEFNLYRTLSRL